MDLFVIGVPLSDEFRCQEARKVQSKNHSKQGKYVVEGDEELLDEE